MAAAGPGVALDVGTLPPARPWYTDVWIQMLHRLAAVLICAAVGFCAWLTRRELGKGHLLSRWSVVWLAMIALQIGLGAATIWSNKAADIATGHVLVGALSLVTGSIMCMICYRGKVLRRNVNAVPAVALPNAEVAAAAPMLSARVSHREATS